MRRKDDKPRWVLSGIAWLVLAGSFFPAGLAALQDDPQKDPAVQKDKSSKKKKPASEKKKPASGKKKKDADAGFVSWQWKDRPSLRFGKTFRIDFRAKFQGDFRGFSPPIETEAGLFDPHRKRVGIGGKLSKHVDYQVETELRHTNALRDGYLDFSYLDKAQIRAGKFKMPFGMEQLTGSMDLDFVMRSLMSDYLTPARDTGVAVHGRLFQRGLNYEAGLFERDGENARHKKNPGAERTFAGRVYGKPLRFLSSPIFRDIDLGVSVASSTVPAGLKGMRGKTITDETFFSEVYVHGQRLRMGLESNWTHGPFSIKGEFVHVQDERRGQGLRGDDLPNLISRGWYVSAGWVLTGEPKGRGVDPKKQFLQGGFGAVEIAARVEALRFGSSEHPGLPSRSPRAANILGNSDRAWTVGINWYVNKWVKIQFNGIREKIEDPQRTPIPGEDRYWMRICRLQFVL